MIRTNRTTTTICSANLLAALSMNDYEVEHPGSYYTAVKRDGTGEANQCLLLRPIYRCLSTNETPPVEATRQALEKFLSDNKVPLSLLDGEYDESILPILEGQDHPAIPCLAFSICKQSYNDTEVCIVPIHKLREYAERGGFYAVSEDRGSFYYNYAKLGNNDPAPGCILRWVGKASSAPGL